MADFATSDAPAVQAQLDRLWGLSPGADILGLDRIGRLLARLGEPHRAMPAVFHVAGTNGKGSTCAFLRAGLEAAGHRVHAYTSPHLVRFNERIRVSGTLIADDALAMLLAEVLDAAEAGEPIEASFFEVTTAAAFLAFARTPADACVVEVGLGGRLDATNVVRPLVCGIAQLGIDHQTFLGDTAEAIAGEKAGIAKRSVPVVTMDYPPSVAARIGTIAAAAGAPWVRRGRDWAIDPRQALPVSPEGSTLRYVDAKGVLIVDRPVRLRGAHQSDNLGLAIAMLRHQSLLSIPEDALRTAAGATRWPARMQRLRDDGPLVRRLPLDRRTEGVWLDGAHNVSAAAAIANSWCNGLATTIVIGILANKDADGVLRHLTATSGACDVIAVPVPGHDHHPPVGLAAMALAQGARSARTAASVSDAFDLLAQTGGGRSVLVAGSLYLAGEVLRENDELPD